MSETSKSLRIDWFDGTVTEETRPSNSHFSEEDLETPLPRKLLESEKKPIGFKRLLDLSLLKPPILNLELSNRPGFWLLFSTDLKDDFIVLIVKILGMLYESLDPHEKSKIGSLLRTKFEKSNFLVELKDYLNGLPKVKITEKRMNMQLWEDVETFYFNLLTFCKAIFHYGGYSKEFLKDLYDVVETAEISALGVQEENMEDINESFYEQISQLRTEIHKSLNSFEEIPVDNLATSTDPEGFRNLSIFPHKEDLVGERNVKIVPNIINGAYTSVEHYLDLQFKLLREDCFGPLREGICKYLKDPSKRRHENIRVYPKVRIIRTYVSNNRVGHLVDIAWADRVVNGSVEWQYRKYAHNKRLMFGSLLLFTSDNFQNILVATVLDSSLDLLKCGYISVSFQNPVSSKVFSEPYLMVESEVFFEPYHRVLKVLQNSRSENLPMKKYIVEIQQESNPPSYLTPQTVYSIQNHVNENEELSFPVLDINQWPSAHSFGLDQSQMDAYTFALTKEFAVIQGPPGTGKTYLGVKIASTLLRNLSLEGTPMLIICYTNHALDQFLEGILNVTNRVVRLGSQSKSKILEPYNLNALRTKMKSKYSYLYANKRAELEKIFKEMTDVQTEIEKCEKEILSYKTVKAHLKIGDNNFGLKSSDEDAILGWLFGHLDKNPKNVDDNQNDVDDWEKQYDELTVSDKIETCFSEEWALKEIDSMQHTIMYVRDITDDHLEGQKITDKFQKQIEKIRNRLECFKKYTSQSLIKKQENKPLPRTQDPYNLTADERWNLYFSAVKNIKSDLMIKMNKLLEQHNTCNDELNEVSTLIDSEVVKTARVVAVTTTLAARRHHLMNKLECPIVIVEEAAEVLEAHIVASLTQKCQHLILIGDHKQLRPTAAHYELARNYNLEISLFERMIRNGVHARTLTTQRRMRANFVELLVPVIYDRLDSHPSVLSYPSVRGLRDTLFFYTHDALEDSDSSDDSLSHRNTVEARWCVVLANYLRRMEYDSKDITILTTYNGQATLIKELSKKYPLLQDVKITVVDNYQGEENRIVILSLVRSNRDGRIGFLAAPNRICVALSRAREGFYMFGNMNVLRSASPVWRAIHDKLAGQHAIGDHIVLQCPQHGDNQLSIQDPDHLDCCLNGSCLKSCV